MRGRYDMITQKIINSYGHTLDCTGLSCGGCQILPCPKYPCVLGSRLLGQIWNDEGVTSSTAHQDINQTIQHLCSWVSPGPATSRASSLTNCPLASPFLQPPTLLQGKLSMLDL